MELDKKLMKLAIKLAYKGKGKTFPNPCVGSVLSDCSGKVIGRGYHRRAGLPHAEVNCINSAKGSVTGSTLYVTLEPCCFFGKTPPCTDLIITSGIRRVVIGSEDPNPKVAGRGIAQLRKAGLEVVSGVLNEETDILIEDFRKYITKGEPFITVKAAFSLDGKIAARTRDSKWISSESSRKEAHYLRGINSGILVGAGTVFTDDPSLNIRLVRGYRDPVRIIIDRDLKTRRSAKMFSLPGKHILITSRSRLSEALKRFSGLNNIKVISCSLNRARHFTWVEIFRKLGSEGLGSILVEGGSGIISSLIKQQAADKFIFFISPRLFGDSRAVPVLAGFSVKSVNSSFKLKVSEYRVIGEDIMLIGYPDYRRH